MLQPENLLLAVAIVAGACAWHRAGFRTPRVLHLPARATRGAVVVLGWTLIVGIALRSVAALFGDARIQVDQSGRYAYRSREPRRFWGEIAGTMLLVAGTGAVLIVVGRKPAPAARDA